MRVPIKNGSGLAVPVLRSGRQKLDFFNRAISPGRVVNGATSAFGSNMLLNFDASSSSVRESIAGSSAAGVKRS